VTDILHAPVRKVTLLEDRASIQRVGTIHLDKGRHRLSVPGVPPALQDVSLRADVDGGTVSDVRVQRAMRVQRDSRPDEIGAVEDEMRALQRKASSAGEQMTRAAQRYRAVSMMLMQGMAELPQDVSWGIADEQGWKNTFEALFRRSRALRSEAVAQDIQQREHIDALHNARTRRQLLAQQHHDFTAEAFIDLIVPEAASYQITLEYTVPGALWRPRYTARLRTDGQVEMTSFAAIWQNTGEDWSDVEVVLSTARSSLGTEPPMLQDDLLQAQRKSSKVQVEAREVTVQTTGPASTTAPPSAVSLPGVDDGGEVLSLRAAEPVSIPSDGHLNTVQLAQFTASASVEHVAFPELTELVFLRSVQRNTGAVPILAGPVELIRDSGPVGFGEVLFVAPGATFELSFGPQDALRLQRRTSLKKKTDPVDKWNHRENTVFIDISNISDERFTLRITERIPVSEIDEIKVSLDSTRTTGDITADDNGFCTWKVAVGPQDNGSVRLHWTLSVAPGVHYQD
jgi:uncharacterized protein (TIGR02231 family)